MSRTTPFGDRALAIVNPAAGGGAGARVAVRLAADFRERGIKLDVVRSPAPDEAARLAREGAGDGYGVIVAVGGDGTANEVANGLVGSPALMALYPIGRGNDFARSLGYPLRRQDIPDFLRAARPRLIDVGEFNGRVFVNAAGVGIDGYVAARGSRAARVLGPTMGYFVGSLGAALTYRPKPMRLRVDGEERNGTYLAAVVANGTHFGAGMRVAPHASMDDGQLDLVLAGNLSRGSSIVALRRLYSGTHVDGRAITHERARELEIEADAPLPAELDGEATTAKRVSIRIRPRALQVLAP